VDNIDSKGRFINVNNTKISNYKTVIDSKWPISTFHEFTLIARLANGVNNLQFDYTYLNEKAHLSINVNLDQTQNNKMEPLHLVIFLTKNSPRQFDMEYQKRQRKMILTAQLNDSAQ